MQWLHEIGWYLGAAVFAASASLQNDFTSVHTKQWCSCGTCGRQLHSAARFQNKPLHSTCNMSNIAPTLQLPHIPQCYRMLALHVWINSPRPQQRTLQNLGQNTVHIKHEGISRTYLYSLVLTEFPKKRKLTNECCTFFIFYIHQYTKK